MTHFMDIIILNLCNWCRQLKIYAPIFSRIMPFAQRLLQRFPILLRQRDEKLLHRRAQNKCFTPSIYYIYLLMKTDILNDSEWEVTQALRSGGSSLVDFSFVAISFSYIMLTSAIES